MKTGAAWRPRPLYYFQITAWQRQPSNQQVAPNSKQQKAGQARAVFTKETAAMTQEQERAVGRWHAEWGPLTELVGLAGGAIKQSNDLFSRLEVHSARMLEKDRKSVV